nr:EOG090X04UC [Triops cancriformis]
MLCRSLKSSHLLRTSLKWNPGATSLYSSSVDDAKRPIDSKSGKSTENSAKNATVTDNKAQAAKQKLTDLLSSLKTVHFIIIPLTNSSFFCQSFTLMCIFLGINTTTTVTTSQVSFTPTFDALAKRELQLMTTHPPRNGFEEMIQWTEQEKVWRFPINNEQGLEEEAKVGFHEHVFLEHHLQGWCPRRGPIRHFMELVCTGLSKNPYITVEQKKEHIMWFRDYFQGKREILTEIGALEDKISLQA